MIKKSMLVGLSSLLLCSAAAFADVDQKLIQKAEKNPVSVKQVKQLRDETPVSLSGEIFKHLNKDHYEFKDSTGIMLLDIDEDVLDAAKVKIGDRVKVWGEVDTHSYKPTNIDVEKLEKLPAVKR